MTVFCTWCERQQGVGEEKRERGRQAQAVSQGICCLQLSHPGEMDATEIEIQGSESRGESFSSWTDVKGHVTKMVWRKSQSDLQPECWKLWEISVSQMSQQFAGLDANGKDCGSSEPGLLEQEVGGRHSTRPCFRSSPGQKQTGRKDVEVGLVLQTKIYRDCFIYWSYPCYGWNSRLNASVAVTNSPTFHSSEHCCFNSSFLYW